MSIPCVSLTRSVGACGCLCAALCIVARNSSICSYVCPLPQCVCASFCSSFLLSVGELKDSVDVFFCVGCTSGCYDMGTVSGSSYIYYAWQIVCLFITISQQKCLI